VEFEAGEHEQHWPARPRDGGSPVPSPSQLPAEDGRHSCPAQLSRSAWAAVTAAGVRLVQPVVVGVCSMVCRTCGPTIPTGSTNRPCWTSKSWVARADFGPY